MHRFHPSSITGLLLVILAFSPPSLASKDNDKQAFKEKMHELRSTVSELLPEITSLKDIGRDLDRQGRILVQAKKLSSLSHDVDEKMKSKFAQNDPTLKFIFNMFKRDSKLAVHALEKGHFEYGRGLIQASLGYCIACHTRGPLGHSFDKISFKGMELLSPIEQADLMTATRQFEPALQAYKKLISKVTFRKQNPVEWERAVRNALAILVRYQEDPKKALQIVTQVLNMKSHLPLSIRLDAKGWQKSLLAWKKEKKDFKSSYSQFVSLMKKAKKAQRYPADHGGDVDYLRATAVGHRLLQTKQASQRQSDILLRIGKAYEILDNPTMGPLHQLYYESCIINSPKTKVAQDCYLQYEQSLLLGFSGSAGVNMPSQVQKNLDRLEAEAFGKTSQRNWEPTELF